MDEVSATKIQSDVSASLAKPAYVPDGLMVFDGTCRLCAGGVRAVARMDHDGSVRFVPAQSDFGRMLCGRAGVDPDDPSTFLFFDHGRALAASDAVLAILRRMPHRWRWLRAVAIIPRSLRDWAYYRVARNRYRLFGRNGCLVPVPEVRSRMREDVPTGAA